MSPVRDSMSSKKGTHSTATATSTPTPTSSTASNPPATPFGAPAEVGEPLRADPELTQLDSKPPDAETLEGKLVDQDNVSIISQVRFSSYPQKYVTFSIYSPQLTSSNISNWQ
jgi:hypothetical protein